ncbi:MAG: amidohydrolase family protein [candidate division Zixibacteria bacterium]|nr:amidohydrolase family protein [candidate division Zixibacteria bacterium]
MRRITHIVLVVFILFAGVEVIAAADTILIKNGTIVPVKGGTNTIGDLLIENGKIIKIGTRIQAPAGAKVIDASGKYVYPGLVAVMTAVGVTGYPGAGNDTDEVGTSTPHMDPYDAINPEDECIEVTRLGGVTTVQTVSGTRSVINGKSVVLHLEGDLADKMVAKRYVSQIINMGAREQNKYPSTQPGIVSFLRTKFDQAKEYAKKQSEAAKKSQKEKSKKDKKDKESLAKRNLEMEALVPVVTGKVPVIFITSNEVTIRNALEIIKEYKLQGIIRASSGILKYADRIAKENIPVIWAGTTGIPRRWEPFDLNYHTAAVLAEKGILFAFDPGGWGPGNRNVRDMPTPASISVAHGLQEKKALEALTINPARILGMESEVGSLEEGKTANVVIWTGSPIQGRSRVETVIIRGKLIPMTSLQTRLYEKFKKIVDERMKKKK